MPEILILFILYILIGAMTWPIFINYYYFSSAVAKRDSFSAHLLSVLSVMFWPGVLPLVLAFSVGAYIANRIWR